MAGTPGSFSDPDVALEAFIRDELQAQHIGVCPSELPAGQEPPEGVCSAELYRSDVLVTFALGLPFSEGIGEAVVSRGEDGAWAVAFVPAPPLDRKNTPLNSNH